MNPPDYALCWDKHSDSIRGIIQNLLKSGNFTDVTLVSDDKKHKRAHKFLLSAASDVFKIIIESIPETEKNSII